MPFKSDKQRKFMYSQHPEIAKKWSKEEHDEKVPGGLASGMSPSQFDQDQLMKGIHVELEHTPDIMMAMEIAMDHLTEDPKYYVKLDAMEKGACDDVPDMPKMKELYGVQAHEVDDDMLDPLGTGIVHSKYPLKFAKGMGRISKGITNQ